MKLVQIPESVLVYDMGPDYFDRLTVVYPDGAVFTTPMNENEYFQYAGKFSQVSTDGAKPLDRVPRYVFERIQRMM